MAYAAKLFLNGKSQALRLPAALRFKAGTRVYIRKDEVSGNLIVSQRPDSWQDFFALRDQLGPQEDFLDRTPTAPRTLDLFP